ncbi:hypothetical protein J2Z21_008985 [Streptomyces griseochromogenes]|uniref:Uncharacterized protein n=1 Tax=Streptomyces griseochromogenes TaxID=68214 RepID=A0ABS4M8I0_9ACTN|nr:hypothetical protein [Streptomyces griseochromogenes]MBP2055968.1 hypothetical protein [Streptomyces griseochromogenes]
MRDDLWRLPHDSSPDRWADEQAVRDQLAYYKLTGDRFFTTYSEPVRTS